MKKFTRRFMASALTAIMAVSTMISVGASAATDDHGNTMATATTFTGSASGTINYAGDVDFFKYTATSTGIKYFVTTGNDSIITIYDSSGSSIGSSLSSYGTKKLAGCKVDQGKTYYISVRENGTNYGTNYTLELQNNLKVSHLCQVDPAWKNIAMKGVSNGETIGTSGCAITSCAMVINYLKGTSITPVTLNSSTYLDSSNGAKWSSIASNYYLSDSGYFTSDSSAISYLQRGYPVIIYISSGHFLVAVGYENGKFMVTDAGKSSSSVVAWNTNYPSATIQKYRVFT